MINKKKRETFRHISPDRGLGNTNTIQYHTRRCACAAYTSMFCFIEAVKILINAS